jgi:hypothetical protein
LEPDRLESWYAAREDAAKGVSIAEKVTMQAQEMIASDEQQAKPLGSGTDGGGEAPQGVAPPIGKCAVGSKRVPSVLELLRNVEMAKTSRGEIAPKGIEVAKAIGHPVELDEGNEVAVKAAPRAEPSKVDDQPRPAGLIKTLGASGIEATKGGGWNVKPKHTTDAGTKWFDISASEGEIDSDDDTAFMEASFFDDFRKGEIQEEDLREALELLKEERELKGLGPSKIRESDIESAQPPEHIASASGRNERKESAIMMKPIHDEEEYIQLLQAEKLILEGELMNEAARLQKSTAKGGGGIVIEQTLEIMQPSQGNGWKASPGNKRPKGAKTPPSGHNKGKGRKS